MIYILCRRISSDTAKEWLKNLKKAEVPVIVCLTYADRLYMECIEESGGTSPRPTDVVKRKIRKDLHVYCLVYLHGAKIIFGKGFSTYI